MRSDRDVTAEPISITEVAGTDRYPEEELPVSGETVTGYGVVEVYLSISRHRRSISRGTVTIGSRSSLFP